MKKLSGVIRFARPEEFYKSYGAPISVGMYGGPVTAWQPCEVPCPYCREPLHEALLHNAGRIVQILSEREPEFEVLHQTVPSTHRVVGCRPCRSMFTLPKAESQNTTEST